MRSLSQETVLRKLLQHESIPRAAAPHELPQHGSLPQGAVLQEQAAPVWVPHWVTSPVSKPAPMWAPLSTGLQVRAEACSSADTPRGHSFLQASTCSSMESFPWAAGGDLLHRGPPWTAGRQPASPWSSSRVAREDSLLRHLEHLLPPASSLTLVSAEFSHVVSLLSNCRLTALFFLPLLKCVIPEALPLSLIGLALASGGSILEPAGTGFIKHGESFS